MTGALLWGVGACLGSAMFWAVSVDLFTRGIGRYGARAINLWKCVIASLMLGALTLAAGQGGAIVALSRRDLALLCVSGVVGLSIADTALFGAVRRLGAYRTLLFMNLAPAFTALTSGLWLSRWPPWTTAAAALVTMVGVVLVLRPEAGTAHARGWPVGGIALALVYALGQGAGVTLAKEGMPPEFPGIAAALLRVGSGAVGLLVVGVFVGRGPRVLVEIARDRPIARSALLATFIGTFLAFILMMAGLARTPDTVASVLLSTTPVFSFALAVSRGHRPLVREIVGGLLAVAGVAWMASTS